MESANVILTHVKMEAACLRSQAIARWEEIMVEVRIVRERAEELKVQRLKKAEEEKAALEPAAGVETTALEEDMKNVLWPVVVVEPMLVPPTPHLPA